MNEEVHELVRRLQEEHQRELAKRGPEERARERTLVEQMHREALEQGRVQQLPRSAEPQTIHYTELPEAKPDSPLYHEWNHYRREAGRLLAEGHEGRFLLIKGEAILGIWDTREEAKAVAVQRYLMQPCLIQQVRTREPLIRLPTRLWGFWGCQS